MKTAKKPAKLSDFKPDARNANKGTERGCGLIEHSLRTYGAGRSILADRHGNIIAGNKTLEGAASIGLDKIRVVQTDGRELVVVQRMDVDLDSKSGRELAIMDNRAGQVSLEWDLGELEKTAADFDIDLASLGFSDGDLAGLGKESPEVVEDEIPEDVPTRCKAGQLWALGAHRLLCGDCRDPAQVARLLGNQNINVAVTSPPYASQRKYDESSGFKPIPPDEYVEWFKPVAANVAEHLADDGSWFVNIKATSEGLDTYLYVLDLVIAHVREWGWHFATEFCWERNGVPKAVSQRFKNQFEPVYQFARGRWKMRPDSVRHKTNDAIVPIGKGAGDTGWEDRQGGNRQLFKPQQTRRRKNGGPSGWGGKDKQDAQGTNWEPGEALGVGMAYPGNRLPTFNGTHEATGHTAAYPVGLPSFFIKAFSGGDDLIFDPFLGSGTTLIAAEQLARRCFGIEISPKYCDIILTRWENFTGKKAVKLDA